MDIFAYIFTNFMQYNKVKLFQDFKIFFFFFFSNFEIEEWEDYFRATKEGQRVRV